MVQFGAIRSPQKEAQLLAEILRKKMIDRGGVTSST